MSPAPRLHRLAERRPPAAAPAEPAGKLIAFPGAVALPASTAPGFDLRTAVARVLSLVAPVRAAEVPTLLLLTANVMVLLGSYYLLKTAREPLVLAAPGGAEVKTYAGALQALLLIPFAQAFGALSARFSRLRLVTGSTLFFVANLLGFWALARAGVDVGVPFYVWVGVFNMAVIAQFWTFVADVYNVEQGRRLLVVVGVGATLGGLLGARAARGLYQTLGTGGLLLTAAGLLLLGLAATAAADRRSAHLRLVGPGPRAALAREPASAAEGSGLRLLLGDRYLQLVAALVVLLNLVNSTGEYLMDRALVTAAHAQTLVPAAAYITSVKADFFAAASLVGMVTQLLFVSRIMKYLGVGAALLVLPLVALGGYGLYAFAPLLPVVLVTKTAENGLDFSLQSTVRQVLFLPTSPAAKYRVKPLIDTIVVRSGDLLASLVVWLGQRLAFQSATFALVNAALTLGWLLVARRLGLLHRSLATGAAPVPVPVPVPAPRLRSAA